jgi:hypothetical protein
MTVTSELVNKTQAIEAVIAEAKARAGEALGLAIELTEQAAAHGWQGVANSMQGAQDCLEQTVATLGNSGDAADEDLSVLGAINEQMSRPEVADHLGQAITRLDLARTALNAATDNLDDARQAAEQAGSPEQMMSLLQTIDDDIDDAQRAVEDTKTATESERQEAVNWGN